MADAFIHESLDRAKTIFADAFSPAETPRMRALSDNGAHGHLILVSDPAEETLPYDGRTEFLSPGGRDVWIADRVETIREAYQTKLRATAKN